MQLQGCHAYLINDFASRVNRRNDEYGGSIENTARLGSEIISSIREACGDDFIVSMRISGADPSVEEAPLIGEQYVKAGCDLLQVSNGIGDCQGFSLPKGVPYNHITALGIKMHEHFKGRVPVSAVNGINTVEKALFLLEHELTDMVDIGRGLLADPSFATAILKGGKYAKCFGCTDCSYGPEHSRPCPALHL